MTNIGKIKGTLELDISNVIKSVKDINKQITDLNKKMVKASTIKVNNKAALTSIKSLNKEMDKLKKSTTKALNVKINSKASEKSVKKISTDFAKIKSNSSMTFKVNTKKSFSDMKKLETLMKRVKKSSVEINNSKALSSIKKIEDALKKVRDLAKITIEVKIASASSDVRRLNDRIKGLNQTVQVDIESKGLSDLKSGLAAASGAAAGVAAGVVATGTSNMGERQDMAMLRAKSSIKGISEKAMMSYLQKAMMVTGGEIDTSVEMVSLAMETAGNDDEKINQQLDTAAGAKVKFSDGITAEAVVESINEAVKTGELAGQLGDVLIWGEDSVKEDGFKAALKGITDEAERYKFIMDAINATGVIDHAETYYSQNEALRTVTDSQLRFSDSFQKFQETLAPVAVQILDLVSKFMDWFNTNEKVTQSLAKFSILTGIVTTIGLILLKIIDLIVKVKALYDRFKKLKWVVNIGRAIVAAISAISVEVLAIIAIVAAVISIFVYWKTVIEALKGAFYSVVGWLYDMQSKTIDAFAGMLEAGIKLYNQLVGVFGGDGISLDVVRKFTDGKAEEAAEKAKEYSQKANDSFADMKENASKTTKAIKDTFTFDLKMPPKNSSQKEFDEYLGADYHSDDLVAGPTDVGDITTQDKVYTVDEINKMGQDAIDKAAAEEAAKKEAERIAKEKEAAAKKAQEERDRIAKEAQKQREEAAKKAQEERDKAIDSLKNSLKSTANNFKSGIKIFEKSVKTYTSATNLLRNARNREKAYTEWSTLRGSLLNDNNITGEFKSELAGMGVDNLADLRAVSKMSQSQKQEMSKLTEAVAKISEKEAVPTVVIEEFVAMNSDTLYKQFAEKLFKDLQRKGIKVQ